MFQTISTFVKDKFSVHGMDVHGGWLYFSQAGEGSVSRARDTDRDGVADQVENIIPPKTLPTAAEPRMTPHGKKNDNMLGLWSSASRRSI